MRRQVSGRRREGRESFEWVMNRKGYDREGVHFEKRGPANATELHVEGGMMIGIRREPTVVIVRKKDLDAVNRHRVSSILLRTDN